MAVDTPSVANAKPAQKAFFIDESPFIFAQRHTQSRSRPKDKVARSQVSLFLCGVGG
jgi:hypothetical protein